MSSNKNEKTLSVCKQLAAEFLAREGNGNSIITVTDATISNNRKYATIFFTVLPIEQEKAALAFAKRKLHDFRDFVNQRARIGKLPFFDFAIDEGEKNRQRIDKLSQTSEK
ncbi:MAG: Ribosome-binding factor A [Parcubacteria group bacterium Gr01-1014_73]|nr:MAG: Ribosome-binding factor A [Parcubacteria group bacterium Gr01-1014_73]